ncbi:MAG: hypothetical protein AB7S78_05745 [Candidatus Omnitrophota bacterium]
MLIFRKVFLYFVLPVSAGVLFGGCASRASGNKGNLQSFPFSNVEAEWIRNGESFQYEDQAWYPADGIESLTDLEVAPVYENKGVTIYIDKIDVKPYNRLYTKFGVNKYRYFKTKKE